MASTTYEHFLLCIVKNCNNFLTAIKTCRFAAIGNMVRNAGELPQPFWLGAACGGGSCGATSCAART